MFFGISKVLKLLKINSSDVCGEYTEHDVVMKNLQTDCKAYHEDTKCQEKNVEDTDASIRRAKKVSICTILYAITHKNKRQCRKQLFPPLSNFPPP